MLATPAEDAVGRSDHDTIDPWAIGPRRRESDRLEPVGIGRALAERVARLPVSVPMDLRRVSDAGVQRPDVQIVSSRRTPRTSTSNSSPWTGGRLGNQRTP